MNKVRILDCTIRDGGYYNNWQFGVKDVNKYLKQVYSSKINVVEIGGGYGFQAIMLYELASLFELEVKKYTVIDLKEVCNLQNIFVNECNKTSEDYANELSKTEEWCEAVIRDMRQKKDDLEDTKMQLAFLVCSCFETFDPSLYSEIEKLHSNLKSVTKPSEYHSSSD